MKKILLIILVAATVLFTGCFEITQNLTINKDGSGILASTTDMSQMVSLAMQMAGDKMKSQKMNMDTTVSMKTILDSLEEMSAANKQLLKNGNIHVIMKMDDNKYVINSSIPFQSVNDVEKITAAMQKEVSGKFLDKAIREALKHTGTTNSGMDVPQQAPALSLPENYFLLTCKSGLISRVANKTKLDSLDQDEMLSQMKQMAAMGAPLKTNFIITLPKPARKVEGKNVKVSDDKKTITISNELSDLFEDPSLFEFKVEY